MICVEAIEEVVDEILYLLFNASPAIGFRQHIFDGCRIVACLSKIQASLQIVAGFFFRLLQRVGNLQKHNSHFFPRLITPVDPLRRVRVEWILFRIIEGRREVQVGNL